MENTIEKTMDFDPEFDEIERMQYLKKKQAWLAVDGFSLRKSRLEELANLLIKHGEFPGNNVEKDDNTEN